MGTHGNGRLANMLGIVYLVVIHRDRGHSDPADGPDERRARTDGAEIHIGRNVLDHQLLDKEGRRCGNVDDLAIEGGPGEPAKSSRSWSGPGYWPQRAGLLGRLAGWIGRRAACAFPGAR